MEQIHYLDIVHTCGNIPHRFLSVYVFWCPHVMAYQLWWGRGESEDPEGMIELPLGPFDGSLDVAVLLASLVSEAALLSLQRP